MEGWTSGHQVMQRPRGSPSSASMLSAQTPANAGNCVNFEEKKKVYFAPAAEKEGVDIFAEEKDLYCTEGTLQMS